MFHERRHSASPVRQVEDGKKGISCVIMKTAGFVGYAPIARSFGPPQSVLAGRNGWRGVRVAQKARVHGQRQVVSMKITIEDVLKVGLVIISVIISRAVQILILKNISRYIGPEMAGKVAVL